MLGVQSHERDASIGGAQLYERWRSALRVRRSGADLKRPQGAGAVSLLPAFVERENFIPSRPARPRGGLQGQAATMALLHGKLFTGPLSGGLFNWQYQWSSLKQ